MENVPAEPLEDYKETLYIPVENAVVEGLKVGSPVNVTVKGKIVSLRQSQEGKGEICVELGKVKVDGENVFSELVEDTEEE